MKMSFGSFIRAKRLKVGYTLRKFAEHINLSPTFVSKMERGEFDPPGEDKIIAMAQALSVNPDELVLMAGRVPNTIKAMILNRPMLVPLLHTANTMNDDDLKQLIDSVIHKMR